jgi:hypothetical protein
MAPIVLAPSDTETLVDAINRASLQGVALQLEPGVHLTSCGRLNTIPIGINGLRLTAVPDPLGHPSKARPIIKRPDSAIKSVTPDHNYGLFLVPAPPTKPEVQQIRWRRYTRGKQDFEFGVILRGRIRISGVGVDCNMGRQGLENLPKGAAEHSAMLGFAGKRYTVASGDVPRYVFTGFLSVELSDIVTSNGGFADDLWFAPSSFNPNIASLRVDRLVSANRLNSQRWTIAFSALSQTVKISRCRVQSLDLEATSGVTFAELPRQAGPFQPSNWTISDLHAEVINLAAKGKTFVVAANRMTTTERFTIYQASGEVRDCSLRVGPARRLIRLNDLVFRRVTWVLDSDELGHVQGLQPTTQYGDSCRVRFVDNTFVAPDDAASGELITSTYSRETPTNNVAVSALGCRYPDTFGRDRSKAIARVRERGTWTFANADLGNRDSKIALPKRQSDDVVLQLV